MVLERALGLYMPLFTLEEVEVFNKTVKQEDRLSAAEVVARYNKVGGCIRKICRPDINDYREEQSWLIQQLSYKTYKQLETDVLAGHHQSPMLFQILSHPPHYKCGGVTWVSQDVAEEALQHFEANTLHLESAVRFALNAKHPYSKTIITAAYREHVVQELKSGGHFQLYNIDPKTGLLIPNSTQIVDLPALSDLLISNEKIEGTGTTTLCTRRPEIWAPSGVSHVDAMYAHEGNYVAIQTTLSDNHDCKWYAFRKFLREAKQKELQFWIVTNTVPVYGRKIVTFSAEESEDLLKANVPKSIEYEEIEKEIRDKLVFKLLVLSANKIDIRVASRVQVW